jgi:hypothetical protein
MLHVAQRIGSEDQQRGLLGPHVNGELDLIYFNHNYPPFKVVHLLQVYRSSFFMHLAPTITKLAPAK